MFSYFETHLRSGFLTTVALATLASPMVMPAANAAVIVYEYTGTVTSTTFGGAFNGLPVTARFTVDTGPTPQPDLANIATNRHTASFVVLDAMVSVGSMVFHSKPFEEFDTSAPPITTNTNQSVFQRNPVPGGWGSGLTHANRVMLQTVSDTTIGNARANSMWLLIDGRLTDGITIPEYPDDLSGFDFAPSRDLVQISLGMQVASTVSTVISNNGSLAIIPEPASLAFLGFGGGLALFRRRRP